MQASCLFWLIILTGQGWNVHKWHHGSFCGIWRNRIWQVVLVLFEKTAKLHLVQRNRRICENIFAGRIHGGIVSCCFVHVFLLYPYKSPSGILRVNCKFKGTLPQRSGKSGKIHALSHFVLILILYELCSFISCEKTPFIFNRSERFRNSYFESKSPSCSRNYFRPNGAYIDYHVLATQLFIHQFHQPYNQTNFKTTHYWPLVRCSESTGHR